MNDQAGEKLEAIVVAFDGSAAARRALARAAILAAERWRVVVIAVAEPEIRSVGGEMLVKGLSRQDAEALVEEAAALLADLDVRFATRVEQGDPADALVTAARGVDAVMIVVGARGQDFVTRVLVGSVASALVDRAHCDVLVVR